MKRPLRTPPWWTQKAADQFLYKLTAEIIEYLDSLKTKSDGSYLFTDDYEDLHENIEGILRKYLENCTFLEIDKDYDNHKSN